MCPNCSFLQIWSHLVKKSLMENLHFLCSVSTFALLKEQRTPDKNIYFPVKNGFSIRRLFWGMCGSLLAHHRVIRNIPGTSFTFTKRHLGKILLPSEATLHGLGSISIDSSFFSHDYISNVRFLCSIHNIQISLHI